MTTPTQHEINTVGELLALLQGLDPRTPVGQRCRVNGGEWICEVLLIDLVYADVRGLVTGRATPNDPIVDGRGIKFLMVL